MATAVASPPVKRRARRDRVMGRHEDLRPDFESADYAHHLRRSAGWEPKHRGDDPTEVRS